MSVTPVGAQGVTLLVAMALAEKECPLGVGSDVSEAQPGLVAQTPLLLLADPGEEFCLPACRHV